MLTAIPPEVSVVAVDRMTPGPAVEKREDNPEAYRQAVRLLARCSLADLNRLRMTDLRELLWRVSGFVPPGPEGEPGSKAVPEKP